MAAVARARAATKAGTVTVRPQEGMVEALVATVAVVSWAGAARARAAVARARERAAVLAAGLEGDLVMSERA